MIGIVGGGLAAAKLVEGYREAGGTEAITIWSQDPRGPYHRPRLSKRVLRGEAEPEDASWRTRPSGTPRTASTCALARRSRRSTTSTPETIVVATGARPRPLPARCRCGRSTTR